MTGRKIRFTNDEQEEPIGELVAYNVHPGREPQGTAKLAFRLDANAPVPATARLRWRNLSAVCFPRMNCRRWVAQAPWLLLEAPFAPRR